MGFAAACCAFVLLGKLGLAGQSELQRFVGTARFRSARVSAPWLAIVMCTRLSHGLVQKVCYHGDVPAGCCDGSLFTSSDASWSRIGSRWLTGEHRRAHGHLTWVVLSRGRLVSRVTQLAYHSVELSRCPSSKAIDAGNH